MNVIVVMLDSLRQDHVSFYNGGARVFGDVRACSTPNIDEFAKQSVAFENAYPEGLPTIPVRCSLMTGQRTLPYRPWEPLRQYPAEITLVDILRQEGYVCGLVSDTYHLMKPGMNFHRGFHSFLWIRGQEYDAYVSSRSRRKVDGYVNGNYGKDWREMVHQFLANTDDFGRKEDWFAARVFDEASKWLKRNREHKKVFLWVDCFDPHEPWDPPEEFDTYTDRTYGGPRLILPMGGEASKWASEEEIRHIRGLYAGEVSFVDDCFGRFVDALEEFGYLDDSVVVVLSDHGHPLADHGKFLKGADRMYNELLKVPFMVRMPGGEGARKVGAIVQFQDLTPTLLDLLGMGNETSSMHGKSFANLLQGGEDRHRDSVITGYHEGIDRCIRDRSWSYVQRPEGQPDELYNIAEDPKERTNLVDEKPDEAMRLSSLYGRYFRRVAARYVKGIQAKYELSSTAFG
ncbi:MAG: sulfatase [Candidatus Brockarchaeota archaeon]|nr:sulfatase [Candidatus Brockarchaeota archaeon]